MKGKPHKIKFKFPNIDCHDGTKIKSIIIFTNTKTRNWFFNKKINEDPVKFKAAVKRGTIIILDNQSNQYT